MPIKKPKKPVREYKNFEEFLLQTWWRRNTMVAFPCRECAGSGKIYDPHDPPCVVEGNKGRNRIKCYKCLGSGNGTKDEWQAAYREYISNFKARLSRYKADTILYNNIVRKLTKEELDFIK